MRPEVVMFLELEGLSEADQPEAREVSAVPATGDLIRFSAPYGSAASVLGADGMYRVAHREWQWDRSGRLRVVVVAERADRNEPRHVHFGETIMSGETVRLVGEADEE